MPKSNKDPIGGSGFQWSEAAGMQRRGLSQRSSRSFWQHLLGISLTFVARLHLLPANISALGSYGFFGNPFLFFLSIIVFDRFVGGFYPGFWYTYAGFAAYPLMGWLARRQPTLSWLWLPTASFLFFLISNFGSWYYWYPHSWSGLALCYTLAVPFYARTLVGDLVFGYGYLIWRRRFDFAAAGHWSVTQRRAIEGS